MAKPLHIKVCKAHPIRSLDLKQLIKGKYIRWELGLYSSRLTLRNIIRYQHMSPRHYRHASVQGQCKLIIIMTYVYKISSEYRTCFKWRMTIAHDSYACSGIANLVLEMRIESNINFHIYFIYLFIMLSMSCSCNFMF